MNVKNLPNLHLNFLHLYDTVFPTDDLCGPSGPISALVGSRYEDCCVKGKKGLVHSLVHVDLLVALRVALSEAVWQRITTCIFLLLSLSLSGLGLYFNSWSIMSVSA